MYWLACRALLGLSVTCPIRVSGVEGWTFVQWCSMKWSRSVFSFSITGFVHRRAGHFLSPNSGAVKAPRMTRAWPGHGVCPLYGNINGILEGGMGVISGQDVVEILLQQVPCWIC